MGNIFSKGYLKGESINAQNINSLNFEKFDLAICASSWDARCICINDVRNFEAESGILILFNNRDSIGLRDKHDNLLKAFLNSNCKNLAIIEEFSTELEKLWNKLFTEIIKAYKKKGSPLKIFLDLSACPRYYFLSIIGECLKYGIVESFHLLYSEGKYLKEQKAKNYNFTDGRWKIVEIPSFEGQCRPGNKKFYFISVGFEGAKTMQVTAHEDPDRISILFPEPGFVEEYVAETWKSNQPLFERYKIPDEQIVRSTASDAIEVWKQLDNASLERPNTENTFYLCCGTKPHAVGFALRAINTKYPKVLYRVPDGHSVTQVEPTNKYWMYIIKDLSAISTTT